MAGTHARIAVLFLALAGGAAARAAEPAVSPALDAAIYKQRCLLCHSTATPEGISERVTAGVAPQGVSNSDAAKNLKASPLKCWRRCTKCWPGRPPGPDQLRSKIEPWCQFGTISSNIVTFPPGVRRRPM